MSCKIDCKYHNQESRNFYIDENSRVWPCCFYATSVTRNQLQYQDYVMYRYTQDNPDWNNLSVNSMSDIIDSIMYQDHVYYPGWSKDPSNICIFNCGDERLRAFKLYKTE